MSPSSLSDEAWPLPAALKCAAQRLARLVAALGRALEQAARDERGAAFAEALIAFPVIFVGFLGLYQLSYLYAADLIVKRAASAAARAAMVFLPDDERYYAGGAPREAYVTEAARRVMLASPLLDPRTLRVTVRGEKSDFAKLTAKIEVGFDCSVFLVAAFCGADNSVPLSAEASLPIQRDGESAP